MTLHDLLARLEAATGPDRELDLDFAMLVMGVTRINVAFAGQSPVWEYRLFDGTRYRYGLAGNIILKFTESSDAVSEAFKERLPLWWICSGDCELGAHASCGPDKARHDKSGVPYPEQWDEGFHIDFKKPSTEAQARCVVMVMALIAQEAADDQ